MRNLIGLVLCITGLTTISSNGGESILLNDVVTATLSFEDKYDPAGFYPHQLLVYLNIVNKHDSQITWVCNQVSDIEAILRIPEGYTPSTGPKVWSIQSNPYAYMLPYGSSLKWLISHGGVSMVGDKEHSYALMVGGNGWLIPEDILPKCFLQIRVHGVPWERSTSTAANFPLTMLFETPLTPIMLKAEQWGPGYPPQGVGSPDP